jgi:hypothetical protein
VAALVGAAGTPSGVALAVTIAGVTLTLTLEHFIYFTLFFCIAALSLVIGLYME